MCPLGSAQSLRVFLFLSRHLSHCKGVGVPLACVCPPPSLSLSQRQTDTQTGWPRWADSTPSNPACVTSPVLGPATRLHIDCGHFGVFVSYPGSMCTLQMLNITQLSGERRRGVSSEGPFSGPFLFFFFTQKKRNLVFTEVPPPHPPSLSV